MSTQNGTDEPEQPSDPRNERRVIREAGQDVRNAGSDIINTWCGLWGNMLIGLGEAISPQSRGSRDYRTTSSRTDETGGSKGRANCIC